MRLHMLHIVAQESPGGDGLFIAILALVLVAGAALVWWSRRKGAVPPALAEPEGDEEGAEELAEAEPEQPEEPLLPEGKTISDGLARTRSQGFMSRIAGIFKKELDETLEDQLEEVLLTSDIGIKTAQKLLEKVKEQLSRSELKDASVVWEVLRTEISAILEGAPGEGPDSSQNKPHVVAVVGVNGTGKTTSVGKLAWLDTEAGKSVMLVAADTFRAAAVGQLEVWADRAGAMFHKGADEQDPASVAFDGIKKGMEAGVDVVYVDTAGRLHTKKNLVEELKKITRVCGKAFEGAPHEILLVLDATTGQNAIQQADIFSEAVGVNSIVLTKLDGTAKGGVVIGICDSFRIPVKYIGCGEQKQDLQPFSAGDFIDGLFEGVTGH